MGTRTRTPCGERVMQTTLIMKLCASFRKIAGGILPQALWMSSGGLLLTAFSHPQDDDDCSQPHHTRGQDERHIQSQARRDAGAHHRPYPIGERGDAGIQPNDHALAPFGTDLNQ